MPVSVAAVIEREVREWDEFSGRLESPQTVEVRPRVSGYIESVHFTAGADVRKGELLFVIDPRPFQAELARADADLARVVAQAALAKSEAARAEKLLASRAISQQEYEQLSSQLRQSDSAIRASRAAVEVARLNLGYTRVIAPISGRIGRAEITAGNYVAVGAVGTPPLTTIVSTDPMYAYFEGDEQAYLRYRKLYGANGSAKRLPVMMGLANEEGFPREGHLDFVDNRLDPKSGTILARAVFSNRDRALTPGLFARIRIVASPPYRALLVSDRAIGTDQNQRFLLVVGPDNVLQYRPVKLGPQAEGLRIVREGLAAGELIVVNGLQRVRPGMPVAPQVVAMDAPPPDPMGMKPPPAPSGTDSPRNEKGGAASGPIAGSHKPDSATEKPAPK